MPVKKLYLNVLSKRFRLSFADLFVEIVYVDKDSEEHEMLVPRRNARASTFSSFLLFFLFRHFLRFSKPNHDLSSHPSLDHSKKLFIGRDEERK